MTQGRRNILGQVQQSVKKGATELYTPEAVYLRNLAQQDTLPAVWQRASLGNIAKDAAKDRRKKSAIGTYAGVFTQANQTIQQAYDEDLQALRVWRDESIAAGEDEAQVTRLYQKELAKREKEKQSISKSILDFSRGFVDVLPELNPRERSDLKRSTRQEFEGDKSKSIAETNPVGAFVSNLGLELGGAVGGAALGTRLGAPFGPVGALVGMVGGGALGAGGGNFAYQSSIEGKRLDELNPQQIAASTALGALGGAGDAVYAATRGGTGAIKAINTAAQLARGEGNILQRVSTNVAIDAGVSTALGEGYTPQDAALGILIPEGVRGAGRTMRSASIQSRRKASAATRAQQATSVASEIVPEPEAPAINPSKLKTTYDAEFKAAITQAKAAPDRMAQEDAALDKLRVQYDELTNSPNIDEITKRKYEADYTTKKAVIDYRRANEAERVQSKEQLKAAQEAQKAAKTAEQQALATRRVQELELTERAKDVEDRINNLYAKAKTAQDGNSKQNFYEEAYNLIENEFKPLIDSAQGKYKTRLANKFEALQIKNDAVIAENPSVGLYASTAAKIRRNALQEAKDVETPAQRQALLDKAIVDVEDYYRQAEELTRSTEPTALENLYRDRDYAIRSLESAKRGRKSATREYETLLPSEDIIERDALKNVPSKAKIKQDLNEHFQNGSGTEFFSPSVEALEAQTGNTSLMDLPLEDLFDRFNVPYESKVINSESGQTDSIRVFKPGSKKGQVVNLGKGDIGKSSLNSLLATGRESDRRMVENIKNRIVEQTQARLKDDARTQAQNDYFISLPTTGEIKTSRGQSAARIAAESIVTEYDVTSAKVQQLQAKQELSKLSVAEQIQYVQDRIAAKDPNTPALVSNLADQRGKMTPDQRTEFDFILADYNRLGTEQGQALQARQNIDTALGAEIEIKKVNGELDAIETTKKIRESGIDGFNVIDC